jgi:ketosteroid isomerase-like protein
MRFPLALLALAIFSSCSHQPAPSAPSQDEADEHSALTRTISALDSAMFAAFNAHDADRLGTWFTPDLEFYHDKTGLAGYDSTMANFRGLFARNADTGLRRELVPGSLEVYPLGEFGLLEVCQHRFCHTENGKQDCGTFRNIMIWRREGDRYKVSRVISYGH